MGEGGQRSELYDAEARKSQDGSGDVRASSGQSPCSLRLLSPATSMCVVISAGPNDLAQGRRIMHSSFGMPASDVASAAVLLLQSLSKVGRDTTHCACVRRYHASPACTCGQPLENPHPVGLGLTGSDCKLAICMSSTSSPGARASVRLISFASSHFSFMRLRRSSSAFRSGRHTACRLRSMSCRSCCVPAACTMIASRSSWRSSSPGLLAVPA